MDGCGLMLALPLSFLIGQLNYILPIMLVIPLSEIAVLSTCSISESRSSYQCQMHIEIVLAGIIKNYLICHFKKTYICLFAFTV